MKRSKHSLSHYKLTSFDMGELVPIGLTEVLPGDTVQHATSALVRVSPLLSPVMHPVHVRIHHWFVPHRLVWSEWEDFITGGDYGSSAPTVPYREFTKTQWEAEVLNGSHYDRMGIPAGTIIETGTTQRFNMMPFRGYNLIWNEWYRDQDLDSEYVVSKAGGSDTTTNTSGARVRWGKDYFTTARPWAQKGSDVVIPMDPASVRSNGADPTFTGSDYTDRTLVLNPAGTWTATSGSAGSNTAHFGSETGLDAFAGTINDLREAFALQRYEEARARYGSRYTEYLRYLGVRSSDARLQRPEYLGGGRQTIQFSEVLQTAPVWDTVNEEELGAVGDLKGHGIAALRSNRYRRFFEEHGYVFSLMSVVPVGIYQTAFPRHYKKTTKEDFWQKELQHIGQQEVTREQVHVGTNSPTEVFGYVDRYDEYRRGLSQVSGDFRDTLNYWHMARTFNTGAEITLNQSFVDCIPTNRIYADTTTNQLLVMAHHSMQARRLVSKNGAPGGL